MIYWFTGQPGAGKTVLGTKLKEFLQTEKRNWRKDVFHIDGDDLILFKPNTITYAVDQHSPLGQRILNSKIGIVFHTKYTGPTLQNLKKSSDVNA